MNDPYIPMNKPSGCWKWSGCMLTIVSALLIAFFVWMIVYSEQEMDKSRQEFKAGISSTRSHGSEYRRSLPCGVHLVFADTFWYRFADAALLLAEVSQVAK